MATWFHERSTRVGEHPVNADSEIVEPGVGVGAVVGVFVGPAGSSVGVGGMSVGVAGISVGDGSGVLVGGGGGVVGVAVGDWGWPDSPPVTKAARSGGGSSLDPEVQCTPIWASLEAQTTQVCSVSAQFSSSRDEVRGA